MTARNISRGPCAVPGCERLARRQGVCDPCYLRRTEPDVEPYAWDRRRYDRRVLCECRARPADDLIECPWCLRPSLEQMAHRAMLRRRWLGVPA